jgi:hypothetical protein
MTRMGMSLETARSSKRQICYGAVFDRAILSQDLGETSFLY